MKKTWRYETLDYLEFMYGKFAKDFTLHDYSDDRRLFANTYNLMVNGITSLPEEPHIFVKVSMNKRIHEECDLLKTILKEFNLA